MPAASSRVPKQRFRLLADCESHLKFLSEALERLQHEVDRYKQLAAELRILVCSTRSNKPLLLDLLDDYGLRALVHPVPRFPFPCTMVGDIQKHGVDVEAVLGLPEADVERLIVEQRSKAKPIPLRQWVRQGLAVYNKGREFSYEELVLVVAHQMGGAHEDVTVEKAVLELEPLSIEGYSGLANPLRELGETVLQAGQSLLRFVSKKHGYQPHSSVI